MDVMRVTLEYLWIIFIAHLCVKKSCHQRGRLDGTTTLGVWPRMLAWWDILGDRTNHIWLGCLKMGAAQKIAKTMNRTPFFWCALFFGTKPCCRMALIRALVGCDDGTSYLLRRLQTGGHHGHQPQRCQPHHGLLEELNHVPNNAYDYLEFKPEDQLC